MGQEKDQLFNILVVGTLQELLQNKGEILYQKSGVLCITLNISFPDNLSKIDCVTCVEGIASKTRKIR